MISHGIETLIYPPNPPLETVGPPDKDTPLSKVCPNPLPPIFAIRDADPEPPELLDVSGSLTLYISLLSTSSQSYSPFPLLTPSITA